MPDLGETLFNDYNYFRSFTAAVSQARARGRYLPDLKRTRERETRLAHMAIWCAERMLDARLWLYSLFVSRHWVMAPPFNQLISDKHVKRYRALSGLDLYDQRLRETADDSHSYDPNKDLSGTVEAMKRSFLENGRAGQCAKAVFETLGYHPKSPLCQMCPVNKLCEQQIRGLLPFDIVALRRGELTVEQAKLQAAMRRGHGACNG